MFMCRADSVVTMPEIQLIIQSYNILHLESKAIKKTLLSPLGRHVFVMPIRVEPVLKGCVCVLCALQTF